MRPVARNTLHCWLRVLGIVSRLPSGRRAAPISPSPRAARLRRPRSRRRPTDRCCRKGTPIGDQPRGSGTAQPSASEARSPGGTAPHASVYMYDGAGALVHLGCSNALDPRRGPASGAFSPGKAQLLLSWRGSDNFNRLRSRRHRCSPDAIPSAKSGASVYAPDRDRAEGAGGTPLLMGRSGKPAARGQAAE